MAEYIEREAVYDICAVECSSCIKCTCKNNNCTIIPVKVACVPAADVAPVRHGKWIKEKGSLWSLANCSICGKLTVEGDASYCPNCGARMDGGGE